MNRVAVTGWGHAFPATVRENQDPVFAWLHDNSPENSNLFTGYRTRRVLAQGEEIDTYMAQACRSAMEQAGITIEAIDGITGAMSNSPHATPNGLANVHRMLGLSPTAWVRPTTDEFTNFGTGLAMASALVGAGRARNILVVTGCNWSRYVDYRTPPAVSAGDGAGAAVVGTTDDQTHWHFVDDAVVMRTDLYGDMVLAPIALPPDGLPPHHVPSPVFTAPVFQMSPRGAADFKTFGAQAPPALVRDLLASHGLTPQDAAVFAYQASDVLLDQWRDALQTEVVESIAEFANMTLATVPVNLSRRLADVTHDWVVGLAMNTSIGCGAFLLHRGPVPV